MHFKALRRDSSDSSDMFVSWEVTVQERRLRIGKIYSMLASILARARALKRSDAPLMERMRDANTKKCLRLCLAAGVQIHFGRRLERRPPNEIQAFLREQKRRAGVSIRHFLANLLHLDDAVICPWFSGFKHLEIPDTLVHRRSDGRTCEGGATVTQ